MADVQRHHHAAVTATGTIRSTSLQPALGEARDEQARARPPTTRRRRGSAHAVADWPVSVAQEEPAATVARDVEETVSVAEALDHVENDDDPHGRERPLPARHGERGTTDVGQAQDVAATLITRGRPDAVVAVTQRTTVPHATVATIVARRNGAGTDAEQEAAADEGDAEGDPAQDAPDAWKRAKTSMEKVVEASYGGWTRYARECDHDEGRRPYVGHERDEREADPSERWRPA